MIRCFSCRTLGVGGELGLMRFGQITSPPSLIHSGRSMLMEEQAVTPAPPWRANEGRLGDKSDKTHSQWRVAVDG